MHEAARQPDKEDFCKAMDKEVKDQLNHGTFKLVKRSTKRKSYADRSSCSQCRRREAKPLLQYFDQLNSQPLQLSLLFWCASTALLLFSYHGKGNIPHLLTVSMR